MEQLYDLAYQGDIKGESSAAAAAAAAAARAENKAHQRHGIKASAVAEAIAVAESSVGHIINDINNYEELWDIEEEADDDIALSVNWTKCDLMILMLIILVMLVQASNVLHVWSGPVPGDELIGVAPSGPRQWAPPWATKAIHKIRKPQI